MLECFIDITIALCYENIKYRLPTYQSYTIRVELFILNHSNIGPRNLFKTEEKRYIKTREEPLCYQLIENVYCAVNVYTLNKVDTVSK